MVFHKATKEKAKLRMALTGPSGSGKTYSALNIAQYLGQKVCVLDTEGNSASKYANLFDFCTLSLTDCHPQNFIKAIDAAVAEGFDVIILDSFSHAYNGKNGLLELADREKMKTSSANGFQVWAKLAPLTNALTQKLLTAPIHIIATLRVKTAYDMQKDDRGKLKPVKIGTEPIQKAGIEYEFDVLGDMDADNNLLIAKTRCPELNGQIFNKPGKEMADILNAWLNDGVEPAAVKKADEGLNKDLSGRQTETAAAAAQQTASAVPPKTTLTLQTTPPKTQNQDEILKQVQDDGGLAAAKPAPQQGFPAAGTFEREGVLKEIKHNSGKGGKYIWGLFLEGVKDAFVTYSQAVNMQAVALVGKAVKIKAVVNNKQAVILSIAPAAN